MFAWEILRYYFLTGLWLTFKSECKKSSEIQTKTEIPIDVVNEKEQKTALNSQNCLESHFNFLQNRFAS